MRPFRKYVVLPRIHDFRPERIVKISPEQVLPFFPARLNDNLS
jgi:hypothetical protein